MTTPLSTMFITLFCVSSLLTPDANSASVKGGSPSANSALTVSNSTPQGICGSPRAKARATRVLRESKRCGWIGPDPLLPSSETPTSASSLDRFKPCA